ncbi:uncharacterized protein LOC142982259 [Anticarsia gemmatalis]|uniref:uncharacterized protein LOC142982259 n=1 Tax=Anticarsia gemmatalis TaxID=129554 RepID=UPI003F774E9B
MFAQYLVYLILTLFTYTAHTQVCNETVLIKGTNVYVEYSKSYTFSRMGTCIDYVNYRYINCRKTAVGTKMYSRFDPFYKTLPRCCEGYTPLKNYTNYDTIDDLVCNPICETPCEHGTCASPNTCECHSGYKLLNGTCRPACTDSCRHGTCLDSGYCQCNYGYRKSMNGTCEPHCNGDCSPGYCSIPQGCYCPPGYLMKTTTHTWYEDEVSCVPECNYCGNGTCVAPNVCKCFKGYVFNATLASLDNYSRLCVPWCENCTGTCVAPNQCENDDGDVPAVNSMSPTPVRAAGTPTFLHVSITSSTPTPAPNTPSTVATSYQKEALQTSWWSRWWWCVVAPVVVVLCGALVLALRRRQGPLVVCFTGRYNVRGDLPDNKECQRVEFVNNKDGTLIDL